MLTFPDQTGTSGECLNMAHRPVLCLVEDKRCTRPDGSGLYVLKMFVTFDGTGDTQGRVVVDYVNPWPGPDFLWSTGRGVWAKSGPNTYSYTFYVFGSNTTGVVFGANRHSGTITLTDCNTAEYRGTFHLVNPDLEPVGGLCSAAQLTFRRILMQEPCQP
jgi:hypothetical protein